VCPFQHSSAAKREVGVPEGFFSRGMDCIRTIHADFKHLIVSNLAILLFITGYLSTYEEII
jgi:hypothetical protein